MRFLKWAAVATLVFVALSTSWIVYRQKQQSNSLPVYGSVEDFQLVDQNGSVFSSRTLAGHVCIVNFIFTSCRNVCPLLTQQMARLQEKTKNLPGGLKLVSISVDPDHDSPKVLSEYAKHYGADFSRWVFLTGPLDAIRKVVVHNFMSAIDANAVENGENQDLVDITHGENFAIVDKAGNIRAFRHAKTEEDLTEILKIVSGLAKN